MQLLALLADSWRESRDRKIFWVILLLTGVVALAMASVGFEGERVSFMFGMFDAEVDHFNPGTPLGRSNIVGLVVYIVLPVFLGWVSVILMIIATAGSFPAMMESGAIEVLLAKPIRRWRLFLYKYLAGMVFVLFQAAVFVGLTFLVMGTRWGVWMPGYLMCIPLIVLLFSYVYCVSVLVAVKTRSTVAAILIGLMAWAAYGMPHRALEAFEQFPSLREYRALYNAVRVANAIAPRTRQLPHLAARWSGAGSSLDIVPPEYLETASREGQAQMEDARRLAERELQATAAEHILPSLAFEAAILVWAMRVFCRRDF
jgi:ABC-type transport system involved in multi-copper enzyme maturation permease subunit